MIKRKDIVDLEYCSIKIQLNFTTFMILGLILRVLSRNEIRNSYSLNKKSYL